MCLPIYSSGSSSKRQESILSQSRPAPLIPESMGEDLPPISRYKRDTTRHRSRNDIIKDMDSGSDSDSEQELPRFYFCFLFHLV